MDYRVDGQTAVVSGASRGIGQAIAIALAASGADIAATARSTQHLDETVAKVRHLGRQCLPLPMDVTDVPSIALAIDHAAHHFGQIDILVNNAGVNVPMPAMRVTEVEWDAVLDTNLKGAFFCAQATARHMQPRGYGRIVNISSAAGLIPAEDRAPYCSSKAALIMLTRQLALEWARFGITVNAVSPTFVETELAAQTLNQPGVREKWIGRIPLGRLATVDDVASAVVYLASPASEFVTGITVPVDGGLTMR
jgi:NAD(P)-dependent dehydrogenase (short-subunit alcohol dehydrogenase family)